MSYFYSLPVFMAYGKVPKEGETYIDCWKAGADFFSVTRFEGYFSIRDEKALARDGAQCVTFPDDTIAIFQI